MRNQTGTKARQKKYKEGLIGLVSRIRQVFVQVHEEMAELEGEEVAQVARPQILYILEDVLVPLHEKVTAPNFELKLIEGRKVEIPQAYSWLAGVLTAPGRGVLELLVDRVCGVRDSHSTSALYPEAQPPPTGDSRQAVGPAIAEDSPLDDDDEQGKELRLVLDAAAANLGEGMKSLMYLGPSPTRRDGSEGGVYLGGSVPQEVRGPPGAVVMAQHPESGRSLPLSALMAVQADPTSVIDSSLAPPDEPARPAVVPRELSLVMALRKSSKESLHGPGEDAHLPAGQVQSNQVPVGRMARMGAAPTGALVPLPVHASGNPEGGGGNTGGAPMSPRMKCAQCWRSVPPRNIRVSLRFGGACAHLS